MSLRTSKAIGRKRTDLDGIDEEGSSHVGAVASNSKTDAGEDDSSLEVLLARLGGSSKIVLSSRLDDGCVDPVYRREVNLEKERERRRDQLEIEFATRKQRALTSATALFFDQSFMSGPLSSVPILLSTRLAN